MLLLPIALRIVLLSLFRRFSIASNPVQNALSITSQSQHFTYLALVYLISHLILNKNLISHRNLVQNSCNFFILKISRIYSIIFRGKHEYRTR